MPPEDLETRRKKLLYQALRRGFKEADLIVGRFAEAALGGLDAAGLDAFEALMSRSDHEIYAMVVGGEPTSPDISPRLIERMREFVAKGGAVPR